MSARMKTVTNSELKTLIRKTPLVFMDVKLTPYDMFSIRAVKLDLILTLDKLPSNQEFDVSFSEDKSAMYIYHV
jgi:hypothetical protein